MSKGLGQLPNAPLVYVLAQVRFSHVPRMDKRWEDIHERLFERFPVVENERIDQVRMVEGHPEVGSTVHRWHLLDEQRSSGLIVASDSLVFHATRYETSKVFLDTFRIVLEQFCEVIPKGVRVTRLGLRYIDLLIPESGLVVNEQIIEAFRLPETKELGVVERMEQVVTYATAVSGRLVVRHRQSITPNLLPGDIFPNNLALPMRLTQEKPEGAIVGIMDYDHFMEKDAAFDAKGISDDFHSLHEVSSKAFIETTTGPARAVWQQEVA